MPDPTETKIAEDRDRWLRLILKADAASDTERALATLANMANTALTVSGVPCEQVIKDIAIEDLFAEAVHALGRIAAGPAGKPYSEPWSMAEAKIALDRMGIAVRRHA